MSKDNRISWWSSPHEARQLVERGHRRRHVSPPSASRRAIATVMTGRSVGRNKVGPDQTGLAAGLRWRR